MYDGLIFIPGLMCDKRLFAPQTSALENTVKIETADITRDADIRSMASRLLEETAFEHFALAGLSLGGIVAMEVVRQAPQRVERLALMDTNHLPDGLEKKIDRKRQIDRARNGELDAMMVEELKPHYVAPLHMSDTRLNTVFVAMAHDLGANVFQRQATALIKRRSSVDTLHQYTGQTLVLCGEHDQPCPVSRHRQMHALLPNSQLVIVPDAGHITTLENPSVVNNALAAWLKA